jgi:hypothetical protein
VESGVILEDEIRQLERSVNTLVRLPSLIRREYWTAKTEKLLLLRGLSTRDRHRLSSLLVLLGASAQENTARQIVCRERDVSIAGHADCDDPGREDDICARP